jgi:hypothetical protein
VVTTSFKKAERSGVVLRAAGIALVDVKLEIGNVSETVTVSAEALNNITLESQAIARGLDEQQLRDLPRNSRDIQDFLTLNPNVLGGSDDIQFLGGRTYGVSYIQDGQASTNAIFGTVGNSAPGLDAISEMQVLSNSYSAEYGGLAGVVVTTRRGGNNYRGSAFYDFNSDNLNALNYNQKLSGAERATNSVPLTPLGGGPIESGKTFLRTQGSNIKAITGGARTSDGGHAKRRLLGHDDHPHRPTDGGAVPGQHHPGEPDRPVGPEDPQLLLPAPEPGHARLGDGRLPAVPARDAEPPAR